MAINTLNRFVFPNEREVGFIVVKLSRRGKFFVVVAFRAIRSEGFLVAVFVARNAFIVHPQKRFLPFFQVGVSHIFGFVAITAIYFFVCACQFIARQVVVEVFFIVAHHVKIAPVVIAVAFRAILSLYIRGYVVPFISVNERLYFLVTRQAFIIGNLAAQIVALGTFRHAFQILVRIRQFPRRQLRGQLPARRVQKGNKMTA